MSDFFESILPEMIPSGPPHVEGAPVAQAPALPQARALRLPHYLWMAGTVLTIAALLHWLGPILTPFLIGAMFAYLGSPAVTWAQRHKVPRTVGTLTRHGGDTGADPRLDSRLGAVGAIRVHAAVETHSGTRRRDERASRTVAYGQVRRRGATRSGRAQKVRRAECHQHARHVVESSRRHSVGRHVAARDPDQPGADPGGDVLSAARLGHPGAKGWRIDAASLVRQGEYDRRSRSTTSSPSSCGANFG